jgi:hypothetical protein
LFILPEKITFIETERRRNCKPVPFVVSAVEVYVEFLTARW